MTSWRALAVGAIVVGVAAAGCGSRCAEIATRQHALVDRKTAAPGPHISVRVPLARANAMIADILRDTKVEVPLQLPKLGPFELPVREVFATARDVRITPGSPGRIRFAMRVDIRDTTTTLTTLAIETEVTPVIAHHQDRTDVVIAFGPANLISVQPELGSDSGRTLVDAISSWLPPNLRDALPRPIVELAARKLAEYLVGTAYKGLQTTLLKRLGSLTELRLQLPEVPIANVALHSIAATATAPDAMIVDITADLPVRRGLSATDVAAGSDDAIAVRITGSALAELTNWAIAHGRLPSWYTRSLEPRADGEFRPRFDYLAEDTARPFKIHVFQERGGCSYFQIGLSPEVSVVDNKLHVVAHDRRIEDANASAIVETVIWLEQLVLGSVETAKQLAAETTLSVGGRSFTTHLVAAAFVHDELQLSATVVQVPR